MANTQKNLHNIISGLLEINEKLWKNVSGIQEKYIFYQDETYGNLSSLIHSNDGTSNTDVSNWLDLNNTTNKLEVKINYGNENLHGLLKVGNNISVSNGIISVPYATSGKAGVIKLGAGLMIADGVVSVKTEDVLNGGTAEKAASATFAEKAASATFAGTAGTAGTANKTVGTLKIGEQMFDGSVDVDLSNAIELSAVTSIDKNARSNSPKLIYTEDGQTAIVTSDNVINTSEEIVYSINDSTPSGCITSVKAIKEYVTNKIETTASKVSISTSTNSDKTTLSWTIDNESGSLDIEKERYVTSGSYDKTTEELVLKIQGSSDVRIPASDLVDEYSPGNGINISDVINGTNVISIKKATNSESFLYVDTSGIGVSGIQTAINNSWINNSSKYTYTGEAPIKVSNNVISVATANGATLGVVKQGTNVSITNGVVSVATANGTNTLGVVKQGTNVSITNGVVSVATANGATLGVVKQGNGLSISNGLASIKKDTNSESFLYVDANGIGISGIQAIQNNIEYTSGFDNGLSDLLTKVNELKNKLNN